MTYKVLEKQRSRYSNYTMVTIRYEDIFLIKEWRNEQLDVLRQKQPLTDEQQKLYFQTVVSKLFAEENPRQILVSYLKDEILIGYGGLVHIDWEDKRAEVSF